MTRCVKLFLRQYTSDIRVASDTAIFGMPEIKVGVPLGLEFLLYSQDIFLPQLILS